ncbi:MAG: hypothetical protein HS116_05885 [Planctomycetes bacterium]|nr:hypothetical protein [Planctomycetota bacterium]
MTTAAAVTLPDAAPSDAEIAAQFEALLPELNSRAERIGRAVARNSVDQEEAAAEVIAHAWLNFRSAARRGTWLPASQLAWVAWHTARSGRLAAGGSSVTDAMDPCAHRLGRANVLSLHRLLGASRRRPKLEFQQNEMARPDRVGRSLTTAEHDSPAERARVHLDWSAFAAQLSPRLRAILCGLAEGWEQREMAAALGVSPGRITQNKAELGTLVLEAFGADILPPTR